MEKFNVDYHDAITLELNSIMLSTTTSCHNLRKLTESMMELIKKQKEVIREQDKIIKEMKGGIKKDGTTGTS